MRALLAGLILAGLLCGCAGGRKPGADLGSPGLSAVALEQAAGEQVELESSLDAAMLKPPSEPYRLGPGDWIEIQVIGDQASMDVTFVCPDGKIYYHLLPGLFVWGKTLAETKAELETGLRQYIQDPRISIILREVKSRRIWILGRVYKSGVYPLVRPMQLLEAIARAGGLMVSGMTASTEELADLKHSFIIRKGRTVPVDFHALLREGDMSQNIYLRPDDFIYLPSSLSQEVYVLGAVTKPTNVPFMNEVSLVGAISKAWGPTDKAHLRQVAIIRGSLSKPTLTVVDYEAILQGRAPNVLLGARDIVYVPDEPFEDFKRFGKLIVDTFVRTVAANEGARAVQRSAEPVGVNIQIGN